MDFSNSSTMDTFKALVGATGGVKRDSHTKDYDSSEEDPDQEDEDEYEEDDKHLSDKTLINLLCANETQLRQPCAHVINLLEGDVNIHHTYMGLSECFAISYVIQKSKCYLQFKTLR